MQPSFFWDKTELTESLNKISTNWVLLCVSSCLQLLPSNLYPASVWTPEWNISSKLLKMFRFHAPLPSPSLA